MNGCKYFKGIDEKNMLLGINVLPLRSGGKPTYLKPESCWRDDVQDEVRSTISRDSQPLLRFNFILREKIDTVAVIIND